MTAHELARLLLTLPDLPVIQQNDCIEFLVVGAVAEDDATWTAPECRGEGPAVALIDCAHYQSRPLPT